MPRRLVAGAALAALAIAVTWTVTPARSAPRRPPRVRFVAAPGASIEVFGRYPKVESSCRRPVQPVLRARYPGTIEIGRDRDGLFVIGVLPFESYLEGLAEVPRKWPMEALKAQVVAARSYALVHHGRPSEDGARLGYDLCATPACQVYAGMAVSHGPYGDRWRRAVSATSREVLLYRGQPAETVYSSTSNGRTYGNDEVFGSDPLPYLRPVRERDDSSSPLSRWRVEIPLDDLRRFLRAGDHWSSGPIAAVARRGGTMVMRGGGGATQKLDVDDFRSSVNYWAPCLQPDSYPALDGGIRLPQTIPSRWFKANMSGRTLIVRGRGWGHGVGLVQWGAYGKAKRGLSYREILRHYYGGLSPQPYPVPRVIRIGIAVGLKAVRVEGAAEAQAPGGRRTDGPWLVGGGKRLRVRHGRPPPNHIRAGSLVRAPDRARAGGAFAVRLFVPQLSVVRLVLEGNGRQINASPEVTKEPGATRVEGRVPVGTPGGRYSIHAIVTDGVDLVRTDSRRIRIAEGGASGGETDPTPTAPRSPAPRAAPRPAPSSPSAAVVLGRAAIALLASGVLITAGFMVARRRRNRASRF